MSLGNLDSFFFILGHFFPLGMGLGPGMKWAKTAEFFDPTVNIVYKE